MVGATRRLAASIGRLLDGQRRGRGGVGGSDPLDFRPIGSVGGAAVRALLRDIPLLESIARSSGLEDAEEGDDAGVVGNGDGVDEGGDEVDPFSSEEEYLEWIETSFVLRRIIVENRKALHASVVHTVLAQAPKSDATEQNGLDEVDKMLSTIADILQLLEGSITERLESQRKRGEVLPRILRLAKALDLTSKEISAVQFILLSNIGSLFPPPAGLSSSLENRSMAHQLAAYAKMTSREVLEFFRPTRKHMQQGLFTLDDEFSSAFSSHFLVMSPEVLRALAGCALSTDEFFKIDKTALADVLLEEPNFAKGREGLVAASTQEVKDASRTKGKDKDTGEVDVEGEDFDLEKLLKDAGISPDEVEDGSAEAEGEEGNEEESAVDGATKSEPTEETTSEFDLKPYTSDLEYLEDQFSVIETVVRIKKVELEDDELSMRLRSDQRKPESILRELRAKQRSLSSQVEKRLALTRHSVWLPRMEQLAKSQALDIFEKNVILALIAAMISPGVRKASGHRRDDISFKQGLDVGTLITLFCDALEDQIRSRSYFYKSGRLIKQGIVKLAESGYFRKKGDLMDNTVELDRRLLDYLVGLDTELSEIVEGSDLFLPRIKLDQVVLPEDQKKLILDTITNFGSFKNCCDAKGITERLSYGTGMCLLFYGPSGTGKTMTANALANHLNKKLLVVDFAVLGAKDSVELMRFVFREAKLFDALVFFDECDSLFESRNQRKSQDLPAMLTELEHYDGLVIMATNRPYDLDEAMYRRINLAIEFKEPDFEMRKQIWQTHVPEGIAVASDIDWEKLAMNFELSGGFIKNAILSALTFAIARDGEDVRLQQQDFEKGAKLQLRGHLQMVEFEQKVVPQRGLDDLVLSEQLETKLREIVSFEKAKKLLFSHWGFDSTSRQGTLCLFHGGISGTGKKTAAQAIAYELGRVVKFVGGHIKNIDVLFKEAKQLDAVLIFDQASTAFGSIVRSQQQIVDKTSLLYHLRRFPGVAVLIAESAQDIDEGVLPHCTFTLEFGEPDVALRTKLWQKLLPSKAPLASDIDLQTLASQFTFTGGDIMSTIYRAAERASLRDPKARVIRMRDLQQAAEEQRQHRARQDRSHFKTIYV